MSNKTKEEIYDEQISPLMTQIIDICKEHKIANICTFSLDLEEGLCCTTAMVADEFEPQEKFREAIRLIKTTEEPSCISTVTVTKADGSKEITAFI